MLGCFNGNQVTDSSVERIHSLVESILLGIHGAPIFSAGQSLYWNPICGSFAEYQLPCLALNRRVPSSSFQSWMFVGCFQKVIDQKPSVTDHLSVGSVVVLTVTQFFQICSLKSSKHELQYGQNYKNTTQVYSLYNPIASIDFLGT